MLKYICKQCDNLESETSVCPVCGNRTTLISSEIYYSTEYKVPVFSEVIPETGEVCRKIGTDVRPVFAQERLLLEVYQGKPMAYAGKSVWSTKGSIYYVDGKKVSISISDLKKRDFKQIINELKQYESENKPYVEIDTTNEYIRKFIDLNTYRLNSITEEAVSYIRNISSGFDHASIFASFSGGKDSTAVSHLVMQALGTQKILHIYGDTTLEYPTSSKYIAEFRRRFPETPVLVAKNKDQDFNDLCEVVGPPSRVMRWCCTVFKTGAITRKIEQTFHDKKRILSFQGIRRVESVSRSKYERDSYESKISKQVVASPIIDWLDFDVWLYVLANGIPFNEAYKQGFTRVGCWCCPNNSRWSEVLSAIYMPDEYDKWKNQLYQFAKNVGKEDWQDYIDDGHWKARQGGNGLEYSKNTVVSFKPCVLEENAYNFELSRPISMDLYEKYGVGEIIEKQGDSLIIDFNEYEIKKFWEAELRSGALKRIF